MHLHLQPLPGFHSLPEAASILVRMAQGETALACSVPLWGVLKKPPKGASPAAIK